MSRKEYNNLCVFENIKELDVDPRRDNDASPASSYRMKVQWCKLVET